MPSDERLLFSTIGWPIGTGKAAPSPQRLETMTNYAFKSRVGLLFLEESRRLGAHLGPDATQLHTALTDRRSETNRVIKRLASRLDEVAPGEWVLFKSIKPFASTPNDTDWFPLDPSRHEDLCNHLLESGDFVWLETAPRQTTLVERKGVGKTDSSKKGGVFYIDCYVTPSTDYFVYMDSSRLGPHVRSKDVDGTLVPVLSASAELAATMFHNVFPERSYSAESYYLIKSYLEEIVQDGDIEEFIEICEQECMEYAVSVNLAITAEIDRIYFDLLDPVHNLLMHRLGHSDLKVKGFTAQSNLPFEIPNKYFWSAFLRKQRNSVSRRSTGLQLWKMLNPIFFADVMKIIWRRSVRGGVYEQN